MKGVPWVDITPYVTVKNNGGKDILKWGKLEMLRFVSHWKALKP